MLCCFVTFSIFLFFCFFVFVFAKITLIKCRKKQLLVFNFCAHSPLNDGPFKFYQNLSNAFCLANIIQCRKCQGFVFINMRSTRKEKQSSGKLRLRERFVYCKWQVGMLLLRHFWCFLCSNIKITSVKNIINKTDFQKSFKVIRKNYVVQISLAVN